MIVSLIRRHYDAILNAAFLVLLTSFLVPAIATRVFGLAESGPAYNRVMLIAMPPALLALLATYLLIFASRLRDEYVDRIWQRAARSFAMAILALPWLWLLVWNAKGFIDPTARWLPTDPHELVLPAWGDFPNSASALQLGGVSYVFGGLFTFAPFAFVGLYKWHAWRDRTRR
ncbi:MAG: hypothetical protein ACKOPE_07670 [Novosphingobium sp.]